MKKIIDLTPKSFEEIPASQKIVIPELDYPMGQTLGGWVINSNELSKGDIKLQADKNRITVGDMILDGNGTITASRINLTNFVPYSDSGITYSGTWNTIDTNTNLAGGRKESSEVDDYFEFTFFGPSIGLFMEKTTDKGKVEIKIDGTAIQTVDLYSGQFFIRPMVFSKTNLSNVSHTLRGTVKTKNASSSANKVGLEGYTLFPNPGIKLEQLSCDLYRYAVNLKTDANGYVFHATTAPTGYCVYAIVGVKLFVDVMSDDVLTDPKVAFTSSVVYLYNGVANTTYATDICLMISKI